MKLVVFIQLTDQILTAETCSNANCRRNEFPRPGSSVRITEEGQEADREEEAKEAHLREEADHSLLVLRVQVQGDVEGSRRSRSQGEYLNVFVCRLKSGYRGCKGLCMVFIR